MEIDCKIACSLQRLSLTQSSCCNLTLPSTSSSPAGLSLRTGPRQLSCTQWPAYREKVEQIRTSLLQDRTLLCPLLTILDRIHLRSGSFSERRGSRRALEAEPPTFPFLLTACCSDAGPVCPCSACVQLSSSVSVHQLATTTHLASERPSKLISDWARNEGRLGHNSCAPPAGELHCNSANWGPIGGRTYPTRSLSRS